MKKKKTGVLVLIAISSMSCLAPEAAAETHLARGEYESAYKKLLERRQRFLDDRAKSIRNLTQVDSWLNQINKGLMSYSFSDANRLQLITTRAYLMSYRDRVRKEMDFQDTSLRSLEKDLAWIELEMKHIACMNSQPF